MDHKNNSKCWCKNCKIVYNHEWRNNNRDKISFYNKKYKKELRKNFPIKKMLYEVKKGAKKRKLEFNIDESDIIIPEICPILGIPLMVNNQKQSNNSASIDRIDNNKGYIKGNVRIISWRANCLKRDASFEEIEKLYFDTLYLREKYEHK